jgi:hypothetical protein
MLGIVRGRSAALRTQAAWPPPKKDARRTRSIRSAGEHPCTIPNIPTISSKNYAVRIHLHTSDIVARLPVAKMPIR